MNTTTGNPFNITKAVDFSDQEINDYWVDIPEGAGFVALAKPTSPMPMLILGGKGSGKTHLMRYFSCPLQMIRHPDIVGGIQSDGYIGIYLRCGGLNSARFKGKGQSEDAWAEVFAYYMELWLSQLVLATFRDVIGTGSELENHEPEICEQLSALIDLHGRNAPASLEGLAQLLQGLQRELDTAVNNCAITQQLAVDIRVTRGNLIFGIPRVISANAASFREVLFLYLIDEFENLTEAQQKYVNTLLRERQNPCTFKIGARMYGVRTYRTYSADEENKEGSEFETLRLDAILRSNPQYPAFARRLITRRLSESGHISSEATSQEATASTLERWFEEPTKTPFASAETSFIDSKYAGKERPYFRRLRQHLEQGAKSGAARGVEGQEGIDRIVASLQCPEYPLLEKLNILLLYKEWSARAALPDAAAVIATECRAAVAGAAEGEGRYNRTLNHFKADLLAQLLRDCDQKQRYVGLLTLIDMSSGLPRNLLILLKHIYSWATFNGERPFVKDPISMRAQEAGVGEASEWFFRDARMIGPEGHSVIDAVSRLGTLFRGIRFSDKPAECSCCTFSGDVSHATADARRILDLAEKWSLLINVGGQRDRNTERVDAKYQVNQMLAPRWDLAVYRRGVLALTPDEINAVFDPAYSASFQTRYETRVERMSAPRFGKRKNGDVPPVKEEGGLFSGEQHG